MRTRKGELSVQARELTLLAKALLPPPEKWHGLTDVEARYRQRYLDLIANPEVRRVFVVRSAMVAAMRRFLDSERPLALSDSAVVSQFRRTDCQSVRLDRTD